MRIRLLYAVLLCIISCQDETEQQDIASLIVGEYLGAGTSSDDVDFEGKGIKVIRLSNTRIRIEPVEGNGFITSFETKVSLQESPNGTLVISVISSSGVSLAADISSNPIALGFENFNNGEVFNGVKN